MADPRKLPHVADGIEEYDNPPPPWLMWLFYGTVAFAAAYCVLFPSLPGFAGLLGWSQLKSYAGELAAAPKAAAGVADEKLGADESVVADLAAVEAGRDIYRRSCASCHGPEGRGLIGPDLRDARWVRGKGEVADIAGIVADGTAKGMPAWKTQLGAADIARVAAFVHGLSHPEDPHHPSLP